MRPTRTLLILLVMAALGGCEGDQAQEASDETTAGAKRPKPRDPTADMVSAVSPAKGAPVELKFALADRPQVGQPLDVEIAVLPVSDVDRIAASFHVGPGLELRQGEHMAAIQNPEPNSPINHRLTVVPQQDGVLFVSATVHVDSPTESISRSFSFPIIAGTSVPPEQSGSATPEKN